MKDYSKLLEYYKVLFSSIDCFHFNSSLTFDIYSGYINIKQGAVIPISHCDIKDNRSIKTFDKENIRLGFIGNTTPYKGYNLLKEVLTKISHDGYNNWTLQVWGNQKSSSEGDKIDFRGKYTSSQLKNVFSGIDLLVVPSICNETFSFITLEALSFGVPVLVSSTVGAKDIVKEYDNFFVFQTKEDLKYKIESLLNNIDLLTEFNQKIIKKPWKHSFQDHVNSINNLYKNI